MASEAHPDVPTTHQVSDPVCGMSVDPSASEHTADHHGERFNFCSVGCKDTFLAHPDLTPEVKRHALWDNPARLYKLGA